MFIIEFLKTLPSEWAVFLGAAFPITEVRATVPLAIIYFKMDPLPAIFLSVIGSVLPILPLLWFLKTLTQRLRQVPSFDKFFDWLFARTRSRSRLIKDFELLGLTLFVAIPFPGTGVWTGTLAAYLFGLPMIPTFICALIGSTIASTIMWLLSAGILRLF